MKRFAIAFVALLGALIVASPADAFAVRSRGGYPPTNYQPFTFIVRNTDSLGNGAGTLNGSGQVADVQFANMDGGNAASLDFASPKNGYVVAHRPGFDASCNVVYYDDTVPFMRVPVRAVYSGSAVLTQQIGAHTTAHMWMAKTIYDPDTVLSVTLNAGGYVDGAAHTSIANSQFKTIVNNSTRAYPLPVGGWLQPQAMLASGSTFHVEFTGASLASIYQHGGRQFACVQYGIETTAGVDQGLTQTVSDPQPSTYVNNTYATISPPEVEAYPADMVISGLTEGTSYNVWVRACPWRGDACLDSRNQAVPLTTDRFTSLRFVADPASLYGDQIAVVRECSSPSCASCTASATYATAYSTGCTTIKLAMDALKTANNAKASVALGKHNDSGGAHVYLSSDSLGARDIAAFGATLTGNNSATTWTVIEPDPNATGIRYVTGASKNPGTAALIYFKNLAITKTTVASSLVDWEMVDCGSSSANHQMIAAENVVFDAPSTDANMSGPFYRCGMSFMLNSTIDQWQGKFSPQGNVGMAWALVAGSQIGANGTCLFPGYMVVGNVFTAGCSIQDTPLASTASDSNDGNLIGWNLFRKQSQIYGVGNVGTKTAGAANIQNLIEQISTNQVSFAADAATNNAVNLITFHNTVAGNRTNSLYTCGTSLGNITTKEGGGGYNLDWRINTKSDYDCGTQVFFTAQTKLSDWPWRNGVDVECQITTNGDSNGSVTYAPSAYLGDQASICLGTSTGRSIPNATVVFVDDQSFGHGGGLGNGQYNFSTCTANLACSVIVGGDVFKYDVNGNLRSQSSEGAGAYRQP